MADLPYPDDVPAEGSAPGPRGRPPVIEPGHTFASVTDKISAIVLTRHTTLGWLAGFFVAFLLLMGLIVTIVHLLMTGIGIWGNNVPVA